MTIISAFGETICISVSGAIGELRLNRPTVRNALNNDLIKAVTEAVQWFNDQSEIKVVIFSGEGKSFCSGFDLAQFSEKNDTEAVRNTIDSGGKLINAIVSMRPVTIAAVHSHCIGGGVLIAMACDFRYVSNCATFKLPETDIGIPLAWGGVPLLTREMGPLLATDFILTCRELTASEALAYRMINRVINLDALSSNTMDLAKRLANHSSLVLEITKSQLKAARIDICSDAGSFSEAHLVHSALLDEKSKKVRSDYIKKISKNNQ